MCNGIFFRLDANSDIGAVLPWLASIVRCDKFLRRVFFTRPCFVNRVRFLHTRVQYKQSSAKKKGFNANLRPFQKEGHGSAGGGQMLYMLMGSSVC